MTTLSIQPASDTYNGDGATDTFAYTFMAFYGVEIIVEVDDVLQVEGTDYTVTGLGDYGGGDIVFEAASIPAAGTNNVVISWDINGIRYIDYSQTARFDADVVNRDINRLWMAFQQHDRGIFDSLTTSGITMNGDIDFVGNQRAITCEETQELIISDYPSDPYNPYQMFRITGGSGGDIRMATYDGTIRWYDAQSMRDVMVFTASTDQLDIKSFETIKIGCGNNFASGFLQFNRIGGTATLDTYNLDIDGGVLQMAGTQVLSTQGAAVANATGAGDVVAQLNTLLSRLRTHGLIAT